MIPEKLKREGIRFVLIEKSGKKPFEKDWNNKNISYSNEQLITHIQNGGNYGVQGGGKNNLLIVDFDNEKLQEELLPKFPETFKVKTGSGKLHLYFFSNKAESFKIFDENMGTLIDVQGEGKQAVAPGSTHPNGNKYEVLEDKEIAFIEYGELCAIIKPQDKKPKKELEIKNKVEYENNTIIETLKGIGMTKILLHIGVDTSKNPTTCPFHESKGGKCLGFNNETAHCFHCDGSWNIFSIVKQWKSLSSKEMIEYLAKNFGYEKEYEEEKLNYIKRLREKTYNEYALIKLQFLELTTGKEKKWSEATEVLCEFIKKKLFLYTTKDDKNSETWVYDNGIYIPNGKSAIKELLREVLDQYYSIFIYNQVIAKMEVDTYIEAEKLFFQEHKEEIPVQNGILNINTLSLEEFTPKKIFFNKLPIIFDITKQCPKIDKFLGEVLSCEDDKNIFYELVGFSLLNDYLFEKAFMFNGNGRNGKSKCLELLKNFVGIENCSAISLYSLENENFSASELFGKRLNMAGDIGNQDLKQTNMFKQLTGRDLISAKRKFLRDIKFKNNAKMIFACNELPMVYDMSKAFWDRWVLLDFPYYFAEKYEWEARDKEKNVSWKLRDENILEKLIVPEELSGLLNQGLLGRQRLLDNKKFSSTMGSDEVKRIWIRRSNSFVAFCYDFVEECPNNRIAKSELRKVYSDYCKKHRILVKSDFVLKKVLEEMFGVGDERTNVLGEVWTYVWVGIRIKDLNCSAGFKL